MSFPATAGAYLAAFSDSALPGVDWAPESMMGVTRSDLREPANSVDYLVIAPTAFKTQAQALANYRADGGYDTKVALLDEIYDEFSYGLLNPEAIRSFLAFAWRYWAKAPRYVVLVGKGTYDWANDTMPPMPVETPDGIFASDNWYADVENDDGVPEMAIGRLPVTTGAELTALIAKIAAYEAQDDAAWNKRVLMVAGPDNNGNDFEPDTNTVAAILSSPYSDSENLKKLFVKDAVDPNGDLISELDAGVFLFNYLGHGNSEFLANRSGTTKIFSVDDINGLNNTSMAPVVVGLTCLINRFDATGADPSLGEQLLLYTGGGAIASWGPTGLSLNANAARLDAYFFRAVFERGETVLGDAVVKALRDYAGATDESRMPGIYVLLGDPALRMPVTGSVGAD